MSRILRHLFTIEHALLLVLLALTGVAAESLATDTPHAPLWLLAIGGGLLGILLGAFRAADSFSHLIAIVLGALGTTAIVAYRQLPGEEALSFWDRFGQIAIDLKDWYFGTTPHNELEDLLVMILLQMIIWLISYLAAWSLVRRGWVTVALVLPAVFVLIAILFGADSRQRLLEIYLIVAIVLLARFTYVRRQRGEGHRRSEGSRQGRGWGSLLSAAVVALIVVSIGSATPPGFSNDTIRPMAEYAGQEYLEAQEGTLDWIEEHLDVSDAGPVSLDSFPRYTAFNDAFSVGGDLNLSDRPEVLVETAGEAPYLSAQSYDTYTGRGWESTVEETFQEEGPDGVRYSPELTFDPEQELPYSGEVRGARVPVHMRVTPLSPSGDMMYSTGMFLSADEHSSVRMSWLQLDNQRFDLRNMALSTIPPDLTGIVSLLLRADELSVEGGEGLLYPPSESGRARLESVRAQLADRFIKVSWNVAADGRVESMFVTGQVPVYEDNVRISRAGGAGGDSSYTVMSLVSGVSVEELRAASTEYPEWVVDRYVELPDSVTPRTVQLTLDLAGDESNPYDQAKVIETFLRQHIDYDLDVGAPPEGADIVDYVLFELRRGYCEYYASAMTVMLRLLGIPAKTVVGYFPGELDQEAGGYVYRQENAHAWTEAYFPGYGWIRFEPTASRPASSFGDLQIPEQPTPTPTPVIPTETPLQPETATPAPMIDQEEPTIPQPVSENPEDEGGTPWALIVGAAALGVAALAGGVWVFAARGSGSEARTLFASLVRWGRAGGVQSDPSSTPREYAHRFGQRYPDIAPDAYEVVGVYEEYRYGNARPSSSKLGRAATALRHLRRQLVRSVFRLRKR